jgi:hypothetical protein
MTFSSQMLIIDPSYSDGSRISALAEFDVVGGMTPPVTPLAGPTMNDESLSIPIGCFSFFGQVYNNIFLSSNGRITFGAANAGSTPVPLNPLCQQPPTVGYWADFDPSSGGSITVSSAGPRSVRIDYNAVPYNGFPVAPTSTFSITLNGISGSIVIDGINGIAPHPAGGSALGLLGISAGAGAITDPGSTTFSVGGPFFPANKTNAIYRLGTPGLLTSGIQRVTFLPLRSGALAGNYQWTVQ